MVRAFLGSQNVPYNNSALSLSPIASPHPPTPNMSQPPPSFCSPLVIGKSFIKQYYHVLTTNPDLIHRFYKSRSIWSHCFEPSVAANPQTLERSSSFFLWASKDLTTGLRIDFGRGAIDAQESIGGGILLVVTGHMTLPFCQKTERPFVHTFFLISATSSGKKRQFYVHNDILRFLTSDIRVPQPVAVSTTLNTEPCKSSQELPKDPYKNTNLVNATLTSLSPTSFHSLDNMSITEGVTPKRNNSGSSSSTSIKEEEVTVSKVKTVKKIKEDKKLHQQKSRGRRVNRRDLRGRDRQSQEIIRSFSSSSDSGKFNVQMTQKKVKSKPNPSYSFESKLTGKLPGSWANLVAGGSGTLAESFVPSFPQVTPSQESIEINDNLDPILVEQNRLFIFNDLDSKKIIANKISSSGSRHISQRTPEATLFCKNVPDQTKEQDIRSIFEPYAYHFNRKILGITLHANRGFCFVDFDHREVVDAILTEIVDKSPVNGTQTTSTHAGSEFIVHGRVLEIGRKVLVDKERNTRRYYSHRQQQVTSNSHNMTSQNHRSGGQRRNHIRPAGTYRQSLGQSTGIEMNHFKPNVQ